MKRGYMITPIVFIALFVIVATFSIYIQNSDDATSQSIAKEGKIKKAIFTTEKKLAEVSSIVYDTIYHNPEINEKVEMEKKIENEIKARTGIRADVVLSNTRNRNTLAKITFPSLVLDYGDVIVDMKGYSYSTVVGHPFYKFYEIYRDFDPKELCGYMDWHNCKLDGQRYIEDKKAETGFDFELVAFKSCTNCGSKKLCYEINITDPTNVATWKIEGRGDYKFKLKTKDGEKRFTVSC
ncbi:MAG: hypothetical protein J7K68_01815 [Candidatus Diapherotrites archaeon]|nr:hypothetical protein [Candidatus Diapherotrites archaeon]